MMRYLRTLADKDIALDRSMIPLGSCTMKLNAAAEMEPITWPEFSRQHPVRAGVGHARAAQADRAISRRWLTQITGYDAVSLQPNAGSQGEYAGLLAIQRLSPRVAVSRTANVCLIPSSAHGTNAASAALAGHAGRRGGVPRQRRRRPRRPARQGRRARATGWPR